MKLRLLRTLTNDFIIFEYNTGNQALGTIEKPGSVIYSMIDSIWETSCNSNYVFDATNSASLPVSVSTIVTPTACMYVIRSFNRMICLWLLFCKFILRPALIACHHLLKADPDRLDYSLVYRSHYQAPGLRHAADRIHQQEAFQNQGP